MNSCASLKVLACFASPTNLLFFIICSSLLYITFGLIDCKADIEVEDKANFEVRSALRFESNEEWPIMNDWHCREDRIKSMAIIIERNKRRRMLLIIQSIQVHRMSSS